MKKSLYIFGLAIATMLAAGCGDDGGGSGPTGSCDVEDIRQPTGLSDCTIRADGYYYVASLFPLTGSLSSFGPTFEQVILLGLEDINEAGGIDGKCLGMIACDTATDPTTAADAMAELVATDPVSIVLGPATSGAVLEAAPEAVAAGVVVITPSATSAAVTDLADEGYVFRTAVSDSYQGVIASAIAEREGFDRVFVIARDDAYGRGLRDVFIATFTASGGQADSVVYDEGEAGFERTVIDAANAYGPDAVFLVSFVDDGAEILKTAVADGWDTPEWILPDGPKDNELLVKVGNDAFLEGALGTSPASPTGADYDAFASAYEQAWGEAPNVFNANCYDALYLAAIGMALATDPDVGSQVRDAMASTSAGTAVRAGHWAEILEVLPGGQVDYQGASGPVDFDENGDVLSNIEEWTIQNGQITSVGCWTPEGEACP